MIDPKWANIAGLVLDAIGAVILTYGLIISKKNAIELGSSYWGGETDEENLKNPPVQDRLKQSRNAIIGGALLVIGFLFQLYGSWPK